MLYRSLARFLFPLVLTIVVQEFGTQMLSAGMARMPQATQTLAAFGLGWNLVLFFASPLVQSKQLGLVLATHRTAFRRTLTFVVAFAVLLMGLQLSLAQTGLGERWIEELHQVSPSLGREVRAVLLWLLPVPLVRSLVLYLAGLLLRAHRTEVITYSTVARFGVGILGVAALLATDSVQRRPILLPILVTYAMFTAELLVVLAGVLRHGAIPSAPPSLQEPSLSYREILGFFWPLALIMLVQEVSRPLINLFVAREPNGTEALAVLTVVYALGQWPYRWLNEIRSIPPAFRRLDPALGQVRRFVGVCGGLSFLLSVALFWTPLRDVLLLQVIGVDSALAHQAHTPLRLFAIFSFVVMVRAYLHGVALVERRTQAIAPSGPMRVAAILVALVALPWLGVQGATRAVGALLSGFVVETLTVWWGLRGRPALGPSPPDLVQPGRT